MRPADSQAIALLNDVEQSVAVGAIEALRSYAIEPTSTGARSIGGVTDGTIVQDRCESREVQTVVAKKKAPFS